MLLNVFAARWENQTCLYVNGDGETANMALYKNKMQKKYVQRVPVAPLLCKILCVNLTEA